MLFLETFVTRKTFVHFGKLENKAKIKLHSEITNQLNNRIVIQSFGKINETKNVYVSTRIYKEKLINIIQIIPILYLQSL